MNTELTIERRAAQRLQNQRGEGGEDRRTSNMVSEGGTEANQEEESGEQVPAWQLESQRVVGSTDFKSYYPSLPIERTAQIVNKMIQESPVKILTDDKELGLFLASTMTREEVVRLNLDEVVQERVHQRGAAPGITSREILSRGPTCPTKWKEPRRAPTEEERRLMLGTMVEIAIKMCMQHHFYKHKDMVRRQTEGAGIGLRLSEALGRAFGLYWDRKLLAKLEKLKWKPLMMKRYVDDLNVVMTGVKVGTRYDAAAEKIEVIENQIAIDEEREVDEITMKVFGEIANSVDPSIDIEVDYPSKYPDKMMPILDMKMAINNQNLVVHCFYRKPQSNKFTMMARSALPDRVKRSTMSNEALRRLLCCSSNLEEPKKVKVMEDFARMLKRSGYSEKFRYEVISDALRGHEKMQQRENEGGQPVDRPREFDEAGRRKRKEEKPGRWFRKEKRGTNIREGVIIVPPTPESSLAKALKKVCDEELRGSKISLSVQERGGKQLGQLLGTSVPGASSKKNCGRQMCFPCNTGQEGICRKTGVGYKITCNLCEETVSSEYAGETGKNCFSRGELHIADVQRKTADKPLWKHILDKHGGRMEITTFEHFSMAMTGVFFKPQRRKANEGVRISNLNPVTRMNSKDEFRQGTNITMRPVRGLGE